MTESELFRLTAERIETHGLQGVGICGAFPEGHSPEPDDRCPVCLANARLQGHIASLRTNEPFSGRVSPGYAYPMGTEETARVLACYWMALESEGEGEEEANG